MINGVSNHYSGISAIYNKSGETKTKKTSEEKYLDKLREQNPGLDIRVGIFDPDAEIESDKNTVVTIHPDELNKMMKDEKYGAKMENILSKIPSIADSFREQLAAEGNELVAFQVAIGRDGSAEAWIYGQVAFDPAAEAEQTEGETKTQNEVWMKQYRIDDILNPNLLDVSI